MYVAIQFLEKFVEKIFLKVLKNYFSKMYAYNFQGPCKIVLLQWFLKNHFCGFKSP